MAAMDKILMIVDPQLDFLEGGSLAVKGAKGIMDDLTRYIEKYGNEYSHILISCDNHPHNHCSFIGNTDINNVEGQWPPHCIAHTVGAAIYKPLMDAVLKVCHNNGIELTILPKGLIDYKEEYSVVDNTENATIIASIMKNSDTQIYITGICGDVCVLSTIKGLINMGFKDNLVVAEEFCPSLDNGETLHNFVQENHISSLK